MTLRVFVPCVVRDTESNSYEGYTRPDGTQARGGTSYSVVVIDSDENKSKVPVPQDAWAALTKMVGKQVQLVLDFVNTKGREGRFQFVAAQNVPEAAKG